MQLRHLDFFPKARRETLDRSAVSGVFSSLAGLLCVILTLSEIAAFLYPPVRAQLGVDLHTEESHQGVGGVFRDIVGGVGLSGVERQVATRKVRLQLEVRFPGIRCGEFGLDYSDALGELSLGVTEGLDQIPYDPENPTVKKPDPLLARGCLLKGSVELARAKGSFHVAFGKKAEARGQAHIHRFTPQELLTFNCSHEIIRFSFGDDFPGATHPLDGTREIVYSGLGRYTYILQIVPAIYTYASGRDVHSFLYAVTEHKRAIHPQPGKPFWQPGLFFQYDFAAYSVSYREERMAFSTLLRNIASIVGGVFTAFSVVSASGRIVEERVTRVKKDQ